MVKVHVFLRAKFVNTLPVTLASCYILAVAQSKFFHASPKVLTDQQEGQIKPQIGICSIKKCLSPLELS